MNNFDLIKRNRKLIFLIFLFFLYFTPSMIVLLSNNYEDNIGYDESFQIQSSLRYLNNQGLSYNLYLFPLYVEDYSTQHLDKATAWPPGYAVSIILLTKSGLSWQQSCILFRILIIIIGLISWIFVAKKIDLPFKSMLIFISVLFWYLFAMGSNTELVNWALFPIILILYFSDFTGKYSSLLNSFILSILVALIVFYKYSSWYIFPVVLLMVIYKYRQKIYLLIGNLVIFLILPIITLFAIINYNNSAKYAIASHINISELLINAFHKFEIAWIFEALNSIFLSPFRIDDVINKIFGLLNFNNGYLFIYAVSLVVFIIFIIIVIFGLKQRRLFHDLIFVLIVSYMGALSYLFLTTGKLPHSTWTPFEESRYFMAILPLIMLTILKYFSKNKFLKTKKATIIIIVFCLITLSYATVRAIVDNSKYALNRVIKKELLQEIENIDRINDCPSIILFSHYNVIGTLFNVNESYLTKLTNKGHNISNINENAYFSKKTLMIIVKQENKKQGNYNYSKYGNEGYSSLLSIEDRNIQYLVAEYKFNKIKNNKFVIFWKIFKKGEKLEGI